LLKGRMYKQELDRALAYFQAVDQAASPVSPSPNG